MTLLRDESASDYCRQLSQKVWVGQCNLVTKGFRQGGVAGFGFRRMLLDETGNPKQELTMGQRKSLLTERVILIPGPEEECQIVLWIYDQFIAGISETDIAIHLNTQGVKTHFGRPWTRGTVCEVLTNEKYVGNNLFNRTSGKMKSKAKPNPEPYTTRHTFAAWSLTVGTGPNKLVNLMGHASKQMIYEVYGRFVEGLDEDREAITEYFGEDFLKRAPKSADRENDGEDWLIELAEAA